MDAAEAQRALDASPLGPRWGFAVDSVGPDRARVRLPIRPELLRPGGVLQGGCAMTLAHVALWSAIMASVDNGHAAVTLEQTSAFLGAARTVLADTGAAALHGDGVAAVGHAVVLEQLASSDGLNAPSGSWCGAPCSCSLV